MLVPEAEQDWPPQTPPARALVAKVTARAVEYLEDGETVQDVLTGQTDASPHSQLMGMIAAVRMITGELQTRLVILTDRNVYVAHSSTLHPSTIKEILFKHTRADAASLVSVSYGVVHVNGYDIFVNDGGRKRAGRFVEAIAASIPPEPPEQSVAHGAGLRDRDVVESGCSQLSYPRRCDGARR
jgi:hypothetical protein